MNTLINKENILSQFGAAASTNGKRLHIIPFGSTWTIKREGKKRATRVLKSKTEAVKVAKTLHNFSFIVVHDKDGSFVTLK